MDKKSNKVNAPVTTQPARQTAEELFAATDAGKMWQEIKDKEIQMFALPAQRVSDYCKPVVVEPSKLYLLTTATSVLPSLEASLGAGFSVSIMDKYTVVTRVPPSPFKK